jgi:hypothetical protein
MPEATKHFDRRFLNMEGYGSSAHYVAEISQWEFDGDNVSATFIIGDCGRTITLDFNTADDGHRLNSFYKLDTLIDGLTVYREQLEKILKEK